MPLLNNFHHSTINLHNKIRKHKKRNKKRPPKDYDIQSTSI